MLDPQWITHQLRNRHGRFVVGYSGGVDSHVLLHLLYQTPLKDRLVAFHVNHGISDNSLVWQAHCQQVCLSLGVKFESCNLELSFSGNLEDEARQGRYQAFVDFMQPEDTLLLAHHQDDQIETALFHLFRGSSKFGLKGMPRQRALGENLLMRLLIDVPRKEIEIYARQHTLRWIEDESNLDTRYTRNYVRRQLLPELESRWSGVRRSVAKSISRDAEVHAWLNQQQEKLYLVWVGSRGEVPIAKLAQLSLIEREFFLQHWFERFGLPQPGADLMAQMLGGLADSAASPQYSWQDLSLVCFHGSVYLLKLPLAVVVDFTNPGPGVHEFAGGRLVVSKGPGGLKLDNLDQLHVRLRRGGEHIRLSQNKSVKKLLQSMQVPPWIRDRMPLIWWRDKLVVLPAIPQVGFAGCVESGHLNSSGDEGWQFVFEIDDCLK